MEITYTPIPAVKASSPWGAVACLSMLTFVLIASEFMPVSLLTPIAAELAVTEGQAGYAIAISGLFAVLTSLFGNGLLARFDRKTVVIVYTALLVLSALIITFAPTYTVFMLGRILVGTAVGGFWSLSTSLLARIVTRDDLPKAIGMLQGGTALAAVVAAPLGSFLGGWIGWRGAFFVVAPIGLAALIWQISVLPSMPSVRTASRRKMKELLCNRVFMIGMGATSLAFMGQFSLATYLRPFLETVTGLNVNMLSTFLLGLGLAGLAGTLISGFVIRSRLNLVLIALPLVLATVALMLVGLGSGAVATAGLLLV